MFYRRFIKIFLDFFASLIAFIVLSPIFIIVSILLFVVNRGNPFYLQKRPGLNGRIFTLIKFKTMNDAVDRHGNLLPDSKRLTNTGKVIRKTSLDEIPQLLNVIKGDMSLIGPRPLLVEYLPRYSEFQKRRHEVKPGITGWAQVNGRNTLSWEDKFEYDVWYVDHLNFILDIKIGFLTILRVFKSEGINADGQATMTRFTGNHYNLEK